ncbi:MAG: PQQ-dependent sugar dehydrogenase [Phenylobacterium sp.]
MRRLPLVILAALLAPAAAVAQAASEETRPPNRAGQHPAFAGQTRAPKVTTATRYQVETVAKGLVNPWSLAFLPDGRMLVTERPGRLRIIGKAGVSPPVKGVPPVAHGAQLGLYGLALDPAFAKTRLVYLAYSAPERGGSALSVARARLGETGPAAQLEDLKVIFRAQPPVSGGANLGGRLVFAPDGTLFVTVGDGFQTKAKAQTLDNDLGKMVRINADGSIPKDNPFVGRAGARPEIWSYGERNGEAAAINPWTHKLWVVEHGARGGDEINIPEAGRNYGWPVITYGIDYSGALIGKGITQAPGLEQPVYYWDPVIAPSGMTFYTGDLFPAWKGNLFVGGLAGERVSRLVLKGDRVVGEEWLFRELGERIRDVVQGPDGALYLLTDAEQGRVLKVVPK